VGIVTFGVPMDLAKSLVEAGQLQSAVETGTYLGDSAIGLRSLRNSQDLWMSFGRGAPPDIMLG
jgi:hypothetical protein